MSKDARQYKRSICYLAFKYRRSFLDGRLCVHLSLYPPCDRKIDIDNRVKILLDALEEATVYANDEQIDKIIIERMPVEPPNGRAVVTISRMGT